MPRLIPLIVCALVLSAVVSTAALPALLAAAAPPTIVMPGAAPAPPGNAPTPGTTKPAGAPGCLPTGNGYLRARIRGALNLDIDWRNAQIECDGGPRSDGSGIRLSFAGPRRSDGERLRMVFGVNAVSEGRSGRALPTNLTVIVEGGQRLYATRGEDRCTVDALDQQRLNEPGTKPRSYRIVARGFCVAPASTLNDAEHILVSRFDFAGSAVFEGSPPSSPQAPAVQALGGEHVR
jgi:hypothetical protein